MDAAANLIIDFDSTFIAVEALDELANIVLKHHPQKSQLIKKLSELTKQGMDGQIGFAESLERRMQMFKPNQQHLQELIRVLKQNITASVDQNRAFFETNTHRIYIISGGFTDYIWPVVSEYGLLRNHVLANEFEWGSNGIIVGYNKNCPLAHNNGKAEQLSLMELNRPIYVIGDGYTDYKVKALGEADKFFAFTENISRASATKAADRIITSFDQVAGLGVA